MSLAALDHIRHERHTAERSRNALQFLWRFRRLDKQYVRAGVTVGRSTGNCPLETFYRNCIGSSDYQCFTCVASIECSLYFANHFLRRDQRLAVEMSATLGECLVLKLDCVCSRAFKKAHRAANIKRVAIAGIRIDDKAGANAISDHG